MGVKTVQAAEWTCDSCGQQELVPLSDESDTPPSGWARGSVVQAYREATWVACRKSHVGKAVNAVLGDEESDE